MFAATEASAQAWLPTKGSFDMSLSYTNTLNKKHYLPNGDELDVGSTRVEVMSVRFTYGITDRLTLSGGIPYVSSWYMGDFPHPGNVDDGNKNKTWTDWRLGLHYQVTEGPIAFAPYVQYMQPITDYDTMGHAASGRGLEEVWLGFFAGRNLDNLLPRSYIQMRYNYAFVEEVASISHNRSNLDIEFGYRIMPRWSVRGVALIQDNYGGIDVPIPRTHPLFPYHDQLAEEDHIILGAGTSWIFSPGSSVSFLYTESVKGKNGHKVDQSVNVGWTWSFAPP